MKCVLNNDNRTNAKITNVSINFVIVPHQADFNSWILKRRVPYTKYLLTMVDSRRTFVNMQSRHIYMMYDPKARSLVVLAFMLGYNGIFLTPFLQ